MKLQIIVTSYARPKYLFPTLESILQDDVEVCVVDGGSDRETVARIRSMAHCTIELHGNPGADVLKNEGVQQFVTNPEFVVSSDDLIFPPDWSKTLMDNYRQINSGAERFTFTACSTEQLIRDYYGKRNPGGNEYNLRNGVEFMEVGVSMVAGSVIDTAAFHRVGGFPVYGKAGCGDVAISKRLRLLGYTVGYFAFPQLDHIGREKNADYPDYSSSFREDESYWYNRAHHDSWVP